MTVVRADESTATRTTGAISMLLDISSTRRIAVKGALEDSNEVIESIELIYLKDVIHSTDLNIDENIAAAAARI